jgi:hypothetical protein
MLRTTAAASAGGALASREYEPAATPTPVKEWSVDDVVKWATQHQELMAAVGERLRAEDVDGAALIELSSEEIKNELKLTLGLRKALERAIRELVRKRQRDESEDEEDKEGRAEDNIPIQSPKDPAATGVADADLEQLREAGCSTEVIDLLTEFAKKEPNLLGEIIVQCGVGALGILGDRLTSLQTCNDETWFSADVQADLLNGLTTKDSYCLSAREIGRIQSLVLKEQQEMDAAGTERNVITVEELKE